MNKIIFCYTVPVTFHFSLETISLLNDKGYEVTLISSEEQKLKEIAALLNVKYIFLDLKRDFSTVKDIISVVKLIFILRLIKPDIIIGATPKAALISMVASRFAGVKHRVYHIFGLPYETSVGIKRKILTSVEKITSQCATCIIPISHSLKGIYVNRFPKVERKIQDIGSLTVGGVDTIKFDRDRFISDLEHIKKRLGMPVESLVIGFVARLTTDKGLGDLIAMWEALRDKRENVVLLVIGAYDTRDQFNAYKLKDFFNDTRVFHFDFTNEVEMYMSIMDVFVLPSYREGFGNVNVEASAMKIPVVTYNVTGCKDSVQNGHSGILVEKRNIESLISAVSYFLDSAQEREKYGVQGRNYVEKYFTRKIVAEQFYTFCSNLSGKDKPKHSIIS